VNGEIEKGKGKSRNTQSSEDAGSSSQVIDMNSKKGTLDFPPLK
jgi:hypothetical protein